MKDVPDAVSGYCDGNCKSFLLFISLFSFFVFMHSTSEVGSMLLIMRCTDPKGLQSFFYVLSGRFNLFFLLFQIRPWQWALYNLPLVYLVTFLVL